MCYHYTIPAYMSHCDPLKVGETRFELVTFASQKQRAARLRYTPIFVNKGNFIKVLKTCLAISF